MAFFAASVKATAPGTSNDVLTLTAAASRRALLHEISVSAMGTASAANELVCARPSTLGVTAVAQTPVAIDPDSAASGATVATGWTTQPDLTSVVRLVRLGCNSNGGVYRWVAKPGEEIALRNNTTVSVSQASLRFGTGGAQDMSVHMIFEDF